MASMERQRPRRNWFDLLGLPWSQARTSAAELVGRRGADVPVEEYTEDDAYVLRAEIPDVDPDKDVDVTVSEGTLAVHAERHEARSQKALGGYRTEFRYGAFSRSVALPPGAKADRAAATYKDGILEVRAPVEPAETSGRKITVEQG
ncbi:MULTISPECIES: Hsp20/alpha crystallin family protein [unclassified Frankia]